MRSYAIVGLLLLHGSLGVVGFNASTLQALHVVDAKRYLYFTSLFRESACHNKDNGAASDRIVANTNEPLLNMREILPLLKHQNILFVGDSVVKIQFAAFAALVWEADTSCERSGMSVYSKKWDFTVEFIRAEHILDIQRPDLYNDLSQKKLSHELSIKLSGKFKTRVPTVLVLSTSHHWIMGKYMQNISSSSKVGLSLNIQVLQQGIARINTLLKPFSNTTRIIWRAVSARHFSNGEWDSGGNCNRTIPYSAAELLHEMAYDSFFIPIQSMYASAVIRKDALISGFEFLDILPNSMLRPDGLVGELHHNSSVIDCVHYCVPGVPDVWNTLLLRLILNPSSGDNEYY